MDKLTRNLLMRLRAKHLRTLEVLGRVESMRAAATEMNITQPAITKQLQDLEDMLEARLFLRSSTGITATPIGHEVIEFARKTVGDVERFAGLVTNLRMGGYGNLNIGTIMASMPELIPRALKTLKSERPLMTIKLIAAPSNQLLTELSNRTIKIAIARLTDPEQSALFDFEPLLEEDVWVFVHKSNPLADCATLAQEELFDKPWVLQSPGTPLRNLLQRTFAETGANALPNWIETNSVYVTLNIVRHAGMIAALPSAIVAAEVASGEFVRLPVRLSYDLDPYGIVTLKKDTTTENSKHFISILRSTARGIIRARHQDHMHKGA